MINLTLGKVHDAMPCISCAPAQIDFLLMGKIGIVHPIEVLKNFSTNTEAGTTGPENGGFPVILPMVFLNGIKNTPPTKREGILIDKPAGRTGIFKGVFVVIIQKFWLYNRRLGVVLKMCDNRMQPIFGHFHIAVQQDKKLFPQMCKSLIITF